MSGETDNGQKESSRSSVWNWLLGLGVALVVYVLSTGPVLLLMRTGRTTAGSPGARLIQIVYHPFDWAIRVPMLDRPLGMYWHLWAPELYDGHGKRR
jgi:hypothetical protein